MTPSPRFHGHQSKGEIVFGVGNVTAFTILTTCNGILSYRDTLVIVVRKI
jgi:hypothetical protein